MNVSYTNIKQLLLLLLLHKPKMKKPFHQFTFNFHWSTDVKCKHHAVWHYWHACSMLLGSFISAWDVHSSLYNNTLSLLPTNTSGCLCVTKPLNEGCRCRVSLMHIKPWEMTWKVQDKPSFRSNNCPFMPNNSHFCVRGKHTLIRQQWSLYYGT